MNDIFAYFLNRNQVRKVRTELYPDPVSSRGEEDLPSRTRGELVNDLSICTGCGECVSACPTQCIELVNGEKSAYGRPNVEIYNIDFSNCIQCGECVSVCEPQSLKHRRQFVRPQMDIETLKKRFRTGK